MLTDDEIATLWSKTPYLDELNGGINFARAIIAATLDKLAAGVSVEPVWYHKNLGDRAHKFYDQTETQPEGCTPLYTADAIAAARVQALSDALHCYSSDDTATDWADKIRAFIGGQQT